VKAHDIRWWLRGFLGEFPELPALSLSGQDIA
jgi:hypothetical protein